MDEDVKDEVVQLLFTLRLLAEDIHVAFTREAIGYEDSQHLRKSYDAGHETPKPKKKAVKKHVRTRQ